MVRGARLGQHFLKHVWAAAKLAHALPLGGDETILEIGPGKGILTRELLKRAPVIAIEKDEQLVAHLRETFADEIASGRLNIVSADIRDVTPESLGMQAYSVAANIPYYITGEIIRQFLTAKKQPLRMALLVQKEVAQRIVSEKESLLSLSVKAYGTPRLIGTVGRAHFSPPPSVDSAILLIDTISRDFFDPISEEAFFDLLHAGFAAKRKQLVGNLSARFDRAALLSAFHGAGIPDKARAEDVSLIQWKALCTSLVRV